MGQFRDMCGETYLELSVINTLGMSTNTSFEARLFSTVCGSLKTRLFSFHFLLGTGAMLVASE